MQNVEIFYRKNRAKFVKIMSLCLNYDRAAAEDVVQEAFYRAIKFEHSFDPERASYKTWFNKILFNALRDYQRDARGYADTNLPEVSVENLMPVEVLRDPLVGKQIYNNVYTTKNEKHRRVLELFFIFGYTSTEISQIEEKVSVTNVTTIVNRFKDQLIEGMK